MYDNNELNDDWDETKSVSSLGEETVISKTNNTKYYKLNGVVDKGYHKIKNGKKAKSTEYFVTNGTTGNCIRDAITGARYNYLVGSPYENLFFKVKYYDNKIKCEENTLFFNTPEDCERLFNMNVSQSVKEKWYTCMNKLQTHINEQNTDSYY